MECCFKESVPFECSVNETGSSPIAVTAPSCENAMLAEALSREIERDCCVILSLHSQAKAGTASQAELLNLTSSLQTSAGISLYISKINMNMHRSNIILLLCFHF